MSKRSGAQISRKAFIQSAVILLLMMTLAGVMTRLVPAGEYARIIEDGRETIDPATFTLVERPGYPVWRWFTAPFEVFFAEGSTILIGIVSFILLVGVAFGVMDRSGILKYVISLIIRKFGTRKYVLLLVITLFFMVLGGFFGIFEEVIPLLPIMIALAYSLGWDSLTGLGMSVLATNVGFSSAVFNPFTIGVAHRLSGLPLFSGAGLRMALFVCTYGILAAFLMIYARKIERKPQASPVFNEDEQERHKYGRFKLSGDDPRMKRGALFLGIFFLLILCVLVASPFVALLSDLALPLTGLLFVIGGIGSGLICGAGRTAWQAAWEGFLGIAPAVPLLMMAASVRHIVASGSILDTMLHWASNFFTTTVPFFSALIIYVLTLVMEVFITSGSAKAFLLIPILMPLADLVGVNRQIAVSAYCFGDGFANMAFPVNAALLITLSLTVIPFTKWFKWLIKLWLWILLATVLFLAVAVAVNYGPF